MPPPKDRRKSRDSAQDLISSNSTTARFVGNAQKSWMSGPATPRNQASGSPQKTSPTTFSYPATLNQTSENVSPIRLGIQIDGDATTRNLSMSVSLLSPKFDREPYPAERHESRIDGGIARVSSSQDVLSDTTNLTSTLDKSISGPKVSDKVATTSLPSPAPSLEHTGKGEQSVLIASPAIVDLTLSRDQPFGGNDEVSGNQDHFRALASTNANSVSFSASTDVASVSDISQSHLSAPTTLGNTGTSGSMPGSLGGLLTESPRNSSGGNCALKAALSPRKRRKVSKRNHPPDQAQATTVLNLSSPRMPGHDFEKCSQILAGRLQAISAISGRGPIEGSRLGLLQEACMTGDYLYLLLHQLFCRRNLQEKSIPYLPDIEAGFEVLSELLASNGQLTLDAIEWFSMFPTSIFFSISECKEDQQTKQKAFEFLKTFAGKWSETRKLYPIHCLPPSSGEIYAQLGADSVVLQQVLFRAIFRSSWPKANSADSRRCDIAFSANQALERSESCPTRTRLTALAKEDFRRILSPYLEPSCPNDIVVVTVPTVNSRPVSSYYDTPAAHKEFLDTVQGSTHSSPPQITTSPSHLITNMNIPNQYPQSGSPSHPSPTANPLIMPESGTTNSSPAMPGQVAFAQPPAVASSWSFDQQHRPYRPNLANEVMPQGPFQRNASGTLEGALNPQSTLLSNAPMMPSYPPMAAWSHLQTRQPMQSNAYPMAAHQVPSQAPRSRVAFTANNQQMYYNPPAFYYPNNQNPPRVGAGPIQFPSNDQFICAPPSRPIESLPPSPNPAVTALHQAQAVPVQLHFVNPNAPQQHTQSFSFVQGIYAHPALSESSPFFEWAKVIDIRQKERFAKISTNRFGQPYRAVANGSYTCHIRCIKLPKPQQGFMESWTLMETCWPTNIAVTLNGRSLEIRRKSHWGKDLAIDVTEFVESGENRITAAVIGFPTGSTDRYQLSLEIVEIADAPRVIAQINAPTFENCRDRILERFRNKDPEVEATQPTIVLDVTDPFTSSIFKIPVRGKECSHLQCFDLDIFLQTRAGGGSREPCQPNGFICPICKGDVRPSMMVVDSFMAKIRADLAKLGRLDAKTVILKEDGSFKIKEEEEITSKWSEESGECSSPQIFIKTEEGLASRLPRKRKASTAIERIDLLND